jgi:ABC-type multidrug transport system fused ATPase/permease subunit
VPVRVLIEVVGSVAVGVDAVVPGIVGERMHVRSRELWEAGKRAELLLDLVAIVPAVAARQGRRNALGHGIGPDRGDVAVAVVIEVVVARAVRVDAVVGNVGCLRVDLGSFEAAVERRFVPAIAVGDGPAVAVCVECVPLVRTAEGEKKTEHDPGAYQTPAPSEWMAEKAVGVERANRSAAGNRLRPRPVEGGMIEVENLTKRYGSFEAIRGVSFRVEKGEVVGFLGPNGAGKTTTMRILCGCIGATSGRALVDGRTSSRRRAR